MIEPFANANARMVHIVHTMSGTTLVEVVAFLFAHIQGIYTFSPFPLFPTTHKSCFVFHSLVVVVAKLFRFMLGQVTTMFLNREMFGILSWGRVRKMIEERMV